MRTHLLTFAITALLIVFAAEGARGQCCGDCNGDGTVVINELITAVNNALEQCAIPGCGFPASGQASSFGPGSDGDVQAGAALSYTDNGDGTITDNNTGLMWETKDHSGGVHDVDNQYTWWGGVSSGYLMDGTMVTEFLAALNTAPCFAGHCDWRIPNVRELQSIATYGGGFGAFDPAFYSANCVPGCTVDGNGGPMCSCTAFSLYWSSTTGPTGAKHDPVQAWTVDFEYGSLNGYTKSSLYAVRAVRGGL